MTRDEIETVVREALRRTLERAFGNESLPHVDGRTQPIGDLGLDSMSGVGFVCDLEDLGVLIGDEQNPFVDDQKRRARTVDEIVQFIETHRQTSGAPG